MRPELQATIDQIAAAGVGEDKEEGKWRVAGARFCGTWNMAWRGMHMNA